MEIISLGGGVQSSALVVLNGLDRIQPKATHAVFADTGAEMPQTYEWINEYLKPWAAAHDIEVVTTRDQKYWPLDEYQLEHKHILMPMFGSRGGMLRRQCTYKLKILPVRRWLRGQGAESATVQLGISTDEAHRAKDADVQWVQHRWPLLDLRMSRQHCINLLQAAELPVPDRSACYMCPFRTQAEWIRIREAQPEIFEQAAELEDAFEGAYLHAARVPLRDLIGHQLQMFEEDGCGGYCWT